MAGKNAAGSATEAAPGAAAGKLRGAGHLVGAHTRVGVGNKLPHSASMRAHTDPDDIQADMAGTADRRKR